MFDFLLRHGPRDFVELQVALPEGVRFVAQDDDGAWWGYSHRPQYVVSQNAWFPDDAHGEPLSCFLAWGPVPFAANVTLKQINH